MEGGQTMCGFSARVDTDRNDIRSGLAVAFVLASCSVLTILRENISCSF